MYRTISLLAIIICVLVGYVYFSKPNTIVINEQGRIEGIINKTRAVIQGEIFWKNQLDLANKKYNEMLSPHLPSSAKMQEMYRKLYNDEKALNDTMKVLYTPEEQIAKSLRIQADSIEIAGKWRILDEKNELAITNEINKYKIIIPIIEAKLHIKKP
jgi:hypothetical protein